MNSFPYGWRTLRAAAILIEPSVILRARAAQLVVRAPQLDRVYRLLHVEDSISRVFVQTLVLYSTPSIWIPQNRLPRAAVCQPVVGHLILFHSLVGSTVHALRGKQCVPLRGD